MTTIAYDAKVGIVAADSQETGEHGQKYNCKKLFRVDDLIVATAGGTYAGMAFVQWLELWDSEPDWEDHPDFTNLDLDEDFECLVIRPNRSCYTVNRLFVPVDQTGNRFIALGSGGPAARGALMTGATPTEAVQIAKKIDTHTGGRVVTLSVD